MPPSVHKLTPPEKRLRRIHFWTGKGHEPTASNCYWAMPQDRTSGTKSVCEPCAQLRRRLT